MSESNGPSSSNSLEPPGREGDTVSGLTLRGRVVSGRREAALFTDVPWVKDRIRDLLGATPYPGTLNLRLAEPASLAVWHGVVQTRFGLDLEPQESGYCAARFFRVLVEGRRSAERADGKTAGKAGAKAAEKAAAMTAGIILPLVPGYPEDVVELVAGEGLRESFGLEDGDEVTVVFGDGSALTRV
jgi:CTP-dependent riboflavin kinase